MRRVALGLSLAIAAALVIQATALSSGGSRDDDVLDFDTMAGVTDPFVGSAHPIRGVNGGGLPWELDQAKGELRADGRLRIEVEGLVLARRAPVPAALQGTNPVPQFAAVVNCLTPAQPVAGENVVTAPVPASADGDAEIQTTVELPSPCVAPVVFVTNGTGAAWFAVTGR